MKHGSPSARPAVRAIALAAGLALAALAAPATAQTAAGGFITGTEWQASNDRTKAAYLLGVADLMSAEHAFQSQRGLVSDRRSAIARLYEGFSGVSIGDAITRVDAFYDDNPERLEETVLEALWITLVEEGTE